MNKKEKQLILTNAKDWFVETLAKNHIVNTKKLINPKEFKINPFLAIYLANFLGGESTPLNIAKALIYPRVLGTSITTSFGTNIQKFTTDVLESYGSTTHGIDIEFIDQTDNHKKYCQLKSGPNTINKDDVETIAGHFSSIQRLAITNNKRITHQDLIVGIVYGEAHEISPHYKRVTSQYYHPVHCGSDFWYRLTGDSTFYYELINAIGRVAIESDFSAQLETVIEKLAETPEIIKISRNL